MRYDSVKSKDLKRIVVIGSSCVGKTTFSIELAGILNIKHIEMDSINWLPDWQERSTSKLRELTKKEVASEKWVLDGNYSRVRDITWTRATHIIWLNYSFSKVAYQAIKRTTYRAFTKAEVCGGNTESIKQSFFSTDSMIVWATKTYHSRRRRYEEQVAKNEYDNLDFIVLKSSKETASFFGKLKKDLLQN